MFDGRLDPGAVPGASTNIHRPVYFYGGEIGSTDAGVFKK